MNYALTPKLALAAFNDALYDKIILKQEIIIGIGRKLKRNHHRFTKPFEISGRRMIVYMDAIRVFGNGRDSSWTLVELPTEDVIILYSEISRNEI